MLSNIWKAKQRTLIAGLCNENMSSKKLFERQLQAMCNLIEVGDKFGRILDVIYLQKNQTYFQANNFKSPIKRFDSQTIGTQISKSPRKAAFTLSMNMQRLVRH